MNDPTIPLDHNALSELLNDPVMNRIVTVVNLARLSILELLEFGFMIKDISRALAKEVIEFDKQRALEIAGRRDVVAQILEKGDQYFELLSSKIRLAKLGLFMLEITEADDKLANTARGDAAHPGGEEETLIHQSTARVAGYHDCSAMHNIPTPYHVCLARLSLWQAQ